MTTPDEATRNDDPWLRHRHLPPATDKRGGHPGSGHGPTMPPPPPDPSGSPSPHDVSDAFTWPAPIPVEHGETLGRILDPVRAHALHEAIRYDQGTRSRQMTDPEAEILRIAEMFETWLARDEAP